MALIKFVRSSTHDDCYVEATAASLVINLRPEITRIYLGFETHFVDVVGNLATTVNTLSRPPKPTVLPAEGGESE